MRFIWISVAVILLDQLAKIALQFRPLSENINFVQGGVALEVLQSSAITAQQINAAMLNGTSWMLAGGLLTILLFASRWNTLFHFISLRTVLGLQLASGGIISHIFDYILRGSVQSSLEFRFYDAFTLKAGIAEFSLISGFILLIYVFLFGATRIHSKIGLLNSTPAKLDFSPLPRGVDNIHIDVQLSPEFCRNISTVAQRLVNRVSDNFNPQKLRQQLTNVLPAALKKSFLTIHQDTLRKAKSSGEPQLIDLLYVSLIKFIHSEVANCVAARINKSKQTTQEPHKRNFGTPKENHNAEHLFRHQDQIIATVNQLILDGLVDEQMINLSKGIKGFLGKSRSFALDAMSSPLLTSNAPEIDTIQFNHYLLFGSEKHKNMSFLQIDRVLDDVLQDYLELIKSNEEDDDTSHSHNREFDGGNTTAEILSQPSVLMHQSNSTILFDQQWSLNKIKQLSRIKQWRKYHKYSSHRRFQQRLAERLLINLKKTGIDRWVVAVYEVKALQARTKSDINPGALIALLVECKNKKELLQRLENIYRSTNTPVDSNEVVKRWELAQKQNNKLLQKYLPTFISDFSHYRRDLLLLYKYHKAADQIELLHDKKSLKTSRSNFTLYEFLLPSEKSDEQTAIRSHIIIKADLRGSTEVTDRLNQMALNPATHFDRNFFSPINSVINDFGAEKVFIEGDAIILILNDYVGTQQNHLIASRACALAAEILRIVAKQNKELLCYGLPKLELGIGIAFSNESPRFLFDGDHKITISPAINRGDRLSACTWSIRTWREQLNAPTTHVEVYQPSERALGHGEKAQKDMVYNLDGILIEEEIFELLQKELHPKRIVNKLPHKQDSQLFAIRAPGNNGESSSLIIRKAPIKVYDPEYRIDECPVVEKRFFYEVIHDEEILDSLRSTNRSRITSS
ncbi:MAG: hypothetical protein ABFS08_11400 [Pseudomonadota bacterium]